ncbi:MAG TPA: maleylacetoacetate isomerase [Steroidobacteraceae bacterium]|nr:maleylacetoacetate isomerase [Steroidobacteraceae bacterium]
MKLYTYFRSSAAFRTRIALNLKGIQYERAPVDLRAPASEQRATTFLALNPQGLVPTLETDGQIIRQSLAIIEYLDETHPNPPLLPRTPLERARVRAMALTIACDIHPLNNLRVLNYLRSPLRQDADVVDTWCRHWISEGFRALEQEVQSTSGDGQHVFGTAVTLADICIVPQMYNARRVKCDVQPYPTLVAICAHLEKLPAFAKAAPEAQPEAG